MKVLIALIIAIILITLLDGCSCPVTKEPVVRIDTLRIYQPETKDTLLLIKKDTVWLASNSNYFIRIDTVKKKVYVDRYKDTLYVPYLDTVIIYQTVQSKDFFDGITLAQILKGGFILLVIVTVVFVARQLGVIR